MLYISWLLIILLIKVSLFLLFIEIPIIVLIKIVVILIASNKIKEWVSVMEKFLTLLNIILIYENITKQTISNIKIVKNNPHNVIALYLFSISLIELLRE